MKRLLIISKKVARSTYGAAEIKSFIPVATWRGFALTLSLSAIVGLLFLLSRTTEIIRITDGIHIGKTEISTVAPPNTVKTELPLLISKSDLQNMASGLKEIASSNVKAVSDDIAKKMNTGVFADISHLSIAGAKEGNGAYVEGVFSNSIETTTELTAKVTKETKIESDEPSEDDVPDVEPTVNLEALHANIAYPEMARKVGIEGKVVINVLISEKGAPIRAKIISSDSPLLEKAAINAVMKGVYTPGRGNGTPVKCWLTIPIAFSLK